MRCFRLKTERGVESFLIHHDKTWALNENFSWDDVLSAMTTAAGRSRLEDVSVEPRLDDDGRLLDRALCVVGSSGLVWGAGLNYRTHSSDLETVQPTSAPGSYLRPNGSLLNNGDPIVLPVQSNRVTGEAEIGVVLGASVKNQEPSDWTDNVAGLTVVLDMTAEDAIRENPRHIPWAKGFDAFCSLGPVVVSLDEFEIDFLENLTVVTCIEGGPRRQGMSSSMKYGIPFLVSYFSQGRTLPAGSVLCTGTPGALPLSDGDTVCARVSGIGLLRHPVRDGSTMVPTV